MAPQGNLDADIAIHWEGNNLNFQPRCYVCNVAEINPARFITSLQRGQQLEDDEILPLIALKVGSRALPNVVDGRGLDHWRQIPVPAQAGSYAPLSANSAAQRAADAGRHRIRNGCGPTAPRLGARDRSTRPERAPNHT